MGGGEVTRRKGLEVRTDFMENATLLDKFGAVNVGRGLIVFVVVDMDGNEMTLLANEEAVSEAIIRLGDALGEEFWNGKREEARTAKSDGKPN